MLLTKCWTQVLCQITKQTRYLSTNNVGEWNPGKLIDELEVAAEAEKEQSVAKPKHGGRSSVSGVIATVFGSNGYLGRAIVNRLGKVGSSVIVPYRGDETTFRELKVMGDLGQIAPLPFDLRQPETIAQAMSHSNVVVNLIGSRWGTKNFSLDMVNHQSAKMIAEMASEMGVERMIHVGALGVHEDSESEFSRSKAKGERAVREAFPGATILKPAEVFGYYDRWIMKYANLLRFHPFFPLPSPERRVQPLFVKDFAEALMHCLENPATIGKEYELGGPEVFTHKELVERISKHVDIPARHALALPHPVTRLMVKYFYSKWRRAHFVTEEIDWFHHDGDALVSKNANKIQDLGIDHPASIDEQAPPLVQMYQYPKQRFLV